MRTIRAGALAVWRLLALCFFVVGVLCVSKILTPLSFVREDIRIQVNKGSIDVNGIYEYRYTGKRPAEVLLFAPFPVEDGMKFPDYVVIEEAGESGPYVPVRVKRLFNKVYFALDCFPGKSTIVRVQYTQKFEGDTFAYILTTTKTWDRPIQNANFEISGLSGNRPLINFPFEKDHDFYRASFRNFFPQVDLKVERIGAM